MSGRLRLVVEADGGSRGNPGVAGYGALVRDPATGTVLAERAAPLGKASNNVAEYQGLIAGLEEALALAGGRPAEVAVRMDSKLVIEQMAGRWKIKHEDMRRLALEARELVRRLEDDGGVVTWTWIPRADNGAADALSNDGMDGLTIARRTGQSTDVDGVGPGAPSGGSAAAPSEGTSAAPSAVPVGTPSGPAVLTGASRLLLVRHGTTDETAHGRLSGRGLLDPALDDLGTGQADALAALVPDLVTAPVRVVASSLRRARQTAAPVAAALGVGVEVDADLDEQDFGQWEGLTKAQIREQWPAEVDAFLDGRTDPTEQRPPGGESTAELAERVGRAVTRLTTGADGGTVVAVTSRRPILVVLGAALGMPPTRFGALATDPGSISCVDTYPDGGVAVPFVNRTPRP